MAPSLEFLPDAMVIEAEWRANHALAQKLEEDRAQQSVRAPSALFLRQARFALVLIKLLRGKKRVACPRDELQCPRLRAHLKETSQCDRKHHDRGATGLTAGVDPERVITVCRRSFKRSKISLRQFVSSR